MINDEVPNLPEITEDNLQFHSVDFAIKELTTSQNIFIFYENSEGITRVLFDHLSAPLYACMVDKFSHPDNSKIYEYLKLILEAVYQMKKANKKGYEVANKIKKYIREKDH